MDSKDLSRQPAAAGLHQYGQTLYGRGDYRQAIEVFNQALKLNSQDPSSILDNRAAAYCKLGDFELALRDAKQILRRNKIDERGYLRAAKVLALNKQLEGALEMYAYGLKTLPCDHRHRSLLQQLHDKLRDKLTARFQDPFKVLPLEIIMMILQYLDFKQIVAILRVSKSWERLLSSLHAIWLHLDLSRARRKIGLPTIRAYINRSKAMLTRATLRNISLMAADKALLFLSRCRNLSHLEVRFPYDGKRLYELFRTSTKLRVLIMSQDVPLSQTLFARFLTDLPNIERIESHQSKPSPADSITWPAKLPNLRAICLSSQEMSPPQCIPVLNVFIHDDNRVVSKTIPNLEELCLQWDLPYQFKYSIDLTNVGFPKLRRLDLSGLDLTDQMNLPPGLEYIRFHNCKSLASHSNEEFRMELPNLSTLILDDSPWATCATLISLLEASQASLRVLHIEKSFYLTGNHFISILGKTAALRGLNELSLAFMPFVNDPTITSILENMPDLQILRVPYTEITGCAIKMIAGKLLPPSQDGLVSAEDKLSKIQQVYVHGCENLSSDAVTYGRERGINVFK